MWLSWGLKRLLAAILLPIIEVLRSIPGTAEIISALEALAALLGAIGLVHAKVARNVSKKKLLSVAALVAILIEVFKLIPALQPYLPLLQQIAAILGAAAAGSALPKK